MELTGLLPVLAWLQILPRLVSSISTEGPGSSAGPLPPPTLSLGSQDPVYYQGEHFSLSCSAPRGEAVMGYRFYRGRGDQTPQELPSRSGAARLELRAETGSQGPYTCRYWRRESGQEIPSTESNKVYITVQGETVTLRCSAPEGERPQGYTFYGEQDRLIHDEVSAPAGAAWLGTVVDMGNAGEYTCEYWTVRSERQILSERSQPVSLLVQAPLAAPSLSRSPPHPVYLPGESVTLTCSPPRGAPVAAGFRFSRDGGQRISSRSSGARVLSITGPEDSGSFTCTYWIRPAGRQIQSPDSRPVSITVTDPPPAPMLSLDPPLTVYLPGERVNLSCSAPGAQEVTGYRFYKRPPEQGSKELPSPQGGPWLEILAAVGDEGPYTCRYWSRGTGRELPSGLSRPIAVHVTDFPRKPSLSLSPAYPAYVAGDRVEINCSAPASASPVQYGLYKSGEPLASAPGAAGTWQTGLQANTGNTSWSFSCTYMERIQGREVLSYASDHVSISVFPAPAAPSLRLIPPHPLYVTGETVTAECVVPAGPHVPRTHWVLRDGESLPEPPEPPRPLNVTPSASGNYRCGYSTELHGRHLRSPPSEPVTLSVTDPPPQPVLSVDPPSGAVNEGLPLLITCTAPVDTSEKRFLFYKDGAEIAPGDMGSEISTTEPRALNLSVLRVPQHGPNSTGEFSCGFKVNMGGRWIPSPWSQAVKVTVTAWSLPIPLVAGCCGAAVGLALLLLLISLCRKKAATRQLSMSYWKSQELRRSRIMRRSTDISGVNICLRPTTEGGWPQTASQDWGLLPKLPGEGPRLGQVAGGAAPLKGHKEEDDADSGAEFEFPDTDPTYTQLTFSCSTFRQGQELSAPLDHVYDIPEM